MNWIFLVIGFLIGFLFFLICLGVWNASRIYGVFRIDRRDLDKLRFRLEFSKDPASISPTITKFVLFKVEAAELKPLEEPNE